MAPSLRRACHTGDHEPVDRHRPPAPGRAAPRPTATSSRGSSPASRGRWPRPSASNRRRPGDRARSSPTSPRCCPFWLGELDRIVLGQASAAVPFGRSQDDPMRIGLIERERTLPLPVLFDRVDAGLHDWELRLATLSATDLARIGRHPRLGEMPRRGRSPSGSAWATPRTTSPSSRTILAAPGADGSRPCSSCTPSRSASWPATCWAVGWSAWPSLRFRWAVAGRRRARRPGHPVRRAGRHGGRRPAGRRSTSPRPAAVLVAVLRNVRIPGMVLVAARRGVATCWPSSPTAA